MTSRSKSVKWLTIILLCLAVFALSAGGCAKKSSSGLTFIEFFDPTWPHCKKMKPIVDEAEALYSEKITFEYYDITKAENDALATKYKVYLTPTFVILSEDEKELDRLIGEVPEKTLRTFIIKNVDKHGKKTTE